jgi:hypothetical protein
VLLFFPSLILILSLDLSYFSLVLFELGLSLGALGSLFSCCRPHRSQDFTALGFQFASCICVLLPDPARVYLLSLNSIVRQRQSHPALRFGFVWSVLPSAVSLNLSAAVCSSPIPFLLAPPGLVAATVLLSGSVSTRRNSFPASRSPGRFLCGLVGLIFVPPGLAAAFF